MSERISYVFARYHTGSWFHLSDYVYYTNGHMHLKVMHVLFLVACVSLPLLIGWYGRTHPDVVNAPIPNRYLAIGGGLLVIIAGVIWYCVR